MNDNLQQMPGSSIDDQTNTSDCCLDSHIAESPTKQDMQVTRRVELKIPVAVFTAHRGYDWSALPDFISYDDAKKLFDKIMSVKSRYYDDFLPIGDAFKGVLYTGGAYAVAFRLMTAEKWDQARRNAYYCACAFIPKEILRDVDFSQLLDMDYFRIPNSNPGALLDYFDEDFSSPSLWECNETLWRFKDGDAGDFDWKQIGTILYEFGHTNDHWFFSRIICPSGSRFVSVFGNWNDAIFRNALAEADAEEEIHTGEMLDDPEMIPLDAPCTQQTVANEQCVNKGEEYDELCRQWSDLSDRFDKLQRNFQTARQERDDAQRLCRSLQHGIRIMEAKSSNRNSSADLFHMLIAFLSGVVLSAVIFWAIHSLTCHSGDGISPGRSTRTDFQSMEDIQ